MFPLPGAPRQQPMDPSRLQAFMNQPSGSAGNAALKPSNARQSKRLFAHNLPSSATDQTIINFFNLQLNGLNVIEGVDPCISAQISKDREFALLEFKTPTEATVALALDGITMDDGESMDTGYGAANGSAQGLSVRRPKDYIVPSVSEETEYEEGVISPLVPDTPNKIGITNLLLNLTDDQVIELLVAFGQLKAFILVKDQSTEESRVSRSQSTHRSRNSISSHTLLITVIIPRALPSANTSTQPQPTSPLKASMAWNSATSTSKSSAPASASRKPPVSRWASTPCLCSQVPHPTISKKAACCSF